MLFDALHQWTTDLPAPETPQFQQGKFNALQKLLPYARAGSHEAASVVLKLDGSEFDFAVGDVDSVDSRIPTNQAVAHLHTHPDEWAQSEVDWSSFLRTTSVEQAHIVTPLRIYSLHKPTIWQTPLTAGKSEIEARYLTFYDEAIASNPGWSRAKDTYWRKEATRQMAQYYNVIFREGIRT